MDKESRDLEEALTEAEAIGDDTLQKKNLKVSLYPTPLHKEKASSTVDESLSSRIPKRDNLQEVNYNYKQQTI